MCDLVHGRWLVVALLDRIVQLLGMEANPELDVGALSHHNAAHQVCRLCHLLDHSLLLHAVYLLLELISQVNGAPVWCMDYRLWKGLG